MRAIRVYEMGAPEVMRLEKAPNPVPKKGQLVVRVHAAGVNPVDTYRRAGAYTRLPQLPWTPGSDAAGVVERVGAGVTRFREGDRVYTDHRAVGAYAERLVAAEEYLHPLPERASFAAGAALGVPYATAYRALFQRGGARPGESVLVHGATGGVGLATVQLARAAGLLVIATGSSGEGRDEALRQGAHHALDHATEGYLSLIPPLTEGRGVDLIIEMAAHRNLATDLPLLARNGRVVVVGNRGTVEINPREAMSRDADIRAFTLFNTPAEDLVHIHAALRAGVENGTLTPVIAEEIPLAEAPRAHHRVLEPGHRGKIVLLP